MEVTSGGIAGIVIMALAYVVGGIAVLGIGVWFGMVATRIMRRQDRAEEDQREPGDRHD
jgi:hypothetical protein